MFISKLEKILEKYEIGEKITRKEKENFYQGNYNLRNSNVKYSLNFEELKEYSICYNSIEYFAEKYCKITLRDYQKQALKNYKDNRFNIWLKSRQIGSTVVTAIFILYEAIFHGKYSVILTNKKCTSIEILNKIKRIYENIPFFLQKGLLSYNNSKISMENGGEISIIGKSIDTELGSSRKIDILFIDEAAYIEWKYYKDLIPTISSYKDSKIILNSTPNGFNEFYDMVKLSESGKSVFNLMKTYWWEVEGRDEYWKNEEIKKLGSLKQFLQEYELNF
jgi:hypothetical protein